MVVLIGRYIQGEGEYMNNTNLLFEREKTVASIMVYVGRGRSRGGGSEEEVGEQGGGEGGGVKKEKKKKKKSHISIF